MIKLTRLNHEPVVVNADFIERIEHGRDTMVILTTGLHLAVRQTPDEVVEAVRRWRESILTDRVVVVPPQDGDVRKEAT